MRVPIRKSGKYTHLKVDPRITQKKFEELTNTLARLKKSRPRVAEEVKTLAQMGDFSENAAYQIAKGRLRGMNQRILDIGDLLRRAVIIEHQKNDGTVQLGHTVTVVTGGKQKNYQILGSSEADPLKGIISHNSPIGSALIGRRIGNSVKIQLGKKEVEYKIIKIA